MVKATLNSSIIYRVALTDDVILAFTKQRRYIIMKRKIDVRKKHTD